MERKKFKSIIAAVTAILIFIVPMLSVVVSAKNDTVPRIWIHGFMNSKVYEDVSDPNSPLAWPPTQEEITTAVEESVPAFAKLAVTKDWDTFGKEMGEITGKLVSRAMNNPDGTVREGFALTTLQRARSRPTRIFILSMTGEKIRSRLRQSSTIL